MSSDDRKVDLSTILKWPNGKDVSEPVADENGIAPGSEGWKTTLAPLTLGSFCFEALREPTQNQVSATEAVALHNLGEITAKGGKVALTSAQLSRLIGKVESCRGQNAMVRAAAIKLLDPARFEELERSV